MLLALILGLILGGAAVIFALQNIFAVTVVFLYWQITASLALLIVLSILVGIIVTILFSIPGAIKNSFLISKLKKDNKILSDEMETLRRKSNDVPRVEPVGPATGPTIL